MGRRIARVWGIPLAAVMSALLLSGGAGAIVGGTPDTEGQYANVGFVVAADQTGNVVDACTGTLIDASAVVTAAHCLADGYRYFVSFKSSVDLAATPTENEFLPVERFHRNETYDVGVLELVGQVTGIEPADLPGVGALNGARKGDAFIHVGYGLEQVVTRRQSSSNATSEFTRRTLASPMSRLSKSQLYTNNREGSICNGDSGGPVFSEDGILVALGNYVANARCQGANSGPRLDITPVQSFLDPYVD